jgi:hypothetical protein
MRTLIALLLMTGAALADDCAGEKYVVVPPDGGRCVPLTETDKAQRAADEAAWLAKKAEAEARLSEPTLQEQIDALAAELEVLKGGSK